ncbi:hypothetical protein PFISCL1PPCAC_14206, partial [Pristionchus fissidentatus]
MTFIDLMLWLSLVDIIALFIISIYNGILFLHGAVYCSSPLLNFVTGCIAMGCWCGASIGSLMLVINRICAFLGTASWLQNNTWLLILISTGYTFYFSLFTPPVGAWEVKNTNLFCRHLFIQNLNRLHCL